MVEVALQTAPDAEMAIKCCASNTRLQSPLGTVKFFFYKVKQRVSTSSAADCKMLLR